MKITLMMVLTADGLIAKHDHHLPDWSSKEDKELFAELTKKAGVMLFGEKTFNTFPAPLPGRLNVVFTENIDKEPIEGVKWVSGDVKEAVKELADEGYREAVLGGGAYLNSLFLEAGLIDELIITYEPLVFGAGLTMFRKEHDAKLELIELKQINKNAFMARYKIVNR